MYIHIRVTFIDLSQTTSNEIITNDTCPFFQFPLAFNRNFTISSSFFIDDLNVKMLQQWPGHNVFLMYF